MLYFLQKAGKISAALGAPASGGWGLCPRIPKLLFSLNLLVKFEHCSDFSASLKKNATYYFTLE